MTGLLVSVRSVAEAEVALFGGADVVDIKEPSRGALGPADPEAWEAIGRAVDGQAVVSAALGELLSEGIIKLASAAALPIAFVKIGLAGCHKQHGWLTRWCEVVRALNMAVQPVPVAYADWPAAGAPSPSVALALAAQTKARLLLIDTHDKLSGGLLDHLSLATLKELVRTARKSQVRIALAGSLNAASIRRLLPLAPDYIGVRGAACVAGRNGTVELSLVKSLARLVKRTARQVAR